MSCFYKYRLELARSISIAVSLIIFNTVFAAYPSQTGGSGLVLMRSASTVGSGQTEMYGYAMADNYSRPSPSVSDLDITLMPGLNYGLSDRIEVGVLLPLRYNTTTSSGGIPGLKGIAKYRFYGNNNKGLASAVTIFAAQPVGGVPASVGSGSTDYGAELNFSILGSRFNTHFSFGYENSDTKQVVPVIGYINEAKLTAAAGLEIDGPRDIDYTLEVATSLGQISKDKNLLIVPAIHFKPRHNLVYSVGMIFGIPADRSKPEMRYFAGVSFNPKKPKPTILNDDNVSTSAALKEIKTDTANIIKTMDEQNKRLDDLEQKTGTGQARTPKVRALVSNARVEVINRAGIAGLGKKVASKLKKKGYDVVNVWVSRKTATKTLIHYRSGYSGDAVKLGHTLPGNQDVLRNRTLPLSVDVRVVVGTDQR